MSVFDDKVVGSMTAGVPSPALGLGIGYVNLNCQANGSAKR